MQATFLRFIRICLRYAFYLFFLPLAACSPANPVSSLEPIRIQVTFAAQPWLSDFHDCAGNNIVETELSSADFEDPQSADLVIRIGQPENLTGPAYLIGTEDLIVIMNPHNPTHQLTADQVRGLFTGRIQTWNSINTTYAPVQVWVYPEAEDVQQFFEKTVLGGIPITSAARLASSPTEMSQAIGKDVNSIGILTRRWKNENTSAVYTSINNLPVLAISLSEPQRTLSQILACLQK